MNQENKEYVITERGFEVAMRLTSGQVEILIEGLEELPQVREDVVHLLTLLKYRKAEARQSDLLKLNPVVY